MGPDAESGNNLGTIAKVLRLLKYWRLIKIMRMSKTLNMIKKSEIYKNLIIAYGDTLNVLQKVLTSTIILLFLCHLIVCFRMTFAKTGLKEDYPTWWTVYCDNNNISYTNDLSLISISW